MNASTIILGAGPAGLHAAYELSKQGHTCLILEARDRIGGRVHTMTAGDGQSFEAGAEFVHGDLPLTAELMKEAGLEKRKSGGRWVSLRGGEASAGENASSAWRAMLKKMRSLEHDVSLQDFLDEHYTGNEHIALKDRAISYAEGFDSADASRASTKALGQEWSSEEGENYRVADGYGRLMEFLAERCTAAGSRIILSHPVSNIVANGEGVVVHTGEKTFRAETVIVALPLGVLQQHGASLLPGAPTYAGALRLLGMGDVIKFVLRFSEDFWEDEYPGLGFLLGAAEVPTWWTQAPEKGTMLTGWMAGRAARAHAHLSEEMLREAALKSLAQTFSRGIYSLEVLLKEAHVFNWSNDPWTLGSYAYATVDSKAAQAVLAQPLGGRVFFAGEYMYDGPAMGTVEAALWSGREAVQLVVKIMNQQAF